MTDHFQDENNTVKLLVLHADEISKDLREEGNLKVVKINHLCYG